VLSYQHAYHAGGPADVHKHMALCLLLDHLAKKDKPFSVIDLYAGEGDYDLTGFAAQKTKEYAEGIGLLWDLKNTAPGVQEYLEGLRRLNPDGTLRKYPGSPALARLFMREGDQLVLNELHATAFPNLGRWARKDARISVHKRDGLEALVGLVPPRVRRGLVLIDPSYEVKTEYTAVPEKLAEAVKKWREGIYVVWYPVLKEGRHHALIDGIKAQVEGEIFNCELSLSAVKPGEEPPGLRGTGLIVVNPPWRFDSAMITAGTSLAKTFGRGKHTATWLKKTETQES
jgi:23S rRNA (adenine2030-N6)-methyltransferase